MTLVESEGRKQHRIGYEPLQAGDTVVAFTNWHRLSELTKDRDWVIVTQDFPREDLRPHKVVHALVFFILALFLILFTDIRPSLSLLTGAVDMIMTRLLSIEEAYRADSWSTVFLLASLIPLGQAVQTTGRADWIAQQLPALMSAYRSPGCRPASRCWRRCSRW